MIRERGKPEAMLIATYHVVVPFDRTSGGDIKRSGLGNSELRTPLAGARRPWQRFTLALSPSAPLPIPKEVNSASRR